MENKINEKVGAWLLVNGNTQEMLAQKIGITRPTLASRLKGESKWTWDEVVQIAQITDCSLNYLAGFDMTDERKPTTVVS